MEAQITRHNKRVIFSSDPDGHFMATHCEGSPDARTRYNTVWGTVATFSYTAGFSNVGERCKTIEGQRKAILREHARAAAKFLGIKVPLDLLRMVKENP